MTREAAAHQLRGRVVALTALNLTVAAALTAAAAAAGVLGAPSMAVIPFAGAIAAAGALQMNVEFGRHACWVTVVEAVVVGMLLHLQPAGVLAAAVLGEALACAWQRQPPAKLLYNLASTAAAAIAAALVFGLLGGDGATDGITWLAVLAAASLYATATHASTSAVLAVLEGGRFHQVFAASLAPVAIAGVVSATIGLVAVVLASVTPAALLLIVPLVLVMVAEIRRLAVHRAEHLRFERLYAASSRTGNLQGLPEVLSNLADEARLLVTGAAGICCTLDRAGEWQGFVVDDLHARPASPAELAAILDVSPQSGGLELPSAAIPEALREALPAIESVVLARSEAGASNPVVLAVLRELGGEDGAGSRGDVLTAFIGHAVLTIANARLYADVAAALAHQVDLNRQKDDFVAVVSHELRTPLASMIGSVATLKRLDARMSTEQRGTLVEMALRQGARLQRLIEELLLLATVEDGQAAACATEAVELPRMVEEIIGALAEQHPNAPRPDIQFVPSDCARVHTDEQKLHQVLCNLIENAYKYAAGGAIRVQASNVGDRILIDVIDSGPGIDPADRERVFERFVQLDQTSTRSHGGTGLGLYLCRQVATLLGGTLTLSEAHEGGCCFTLTLPAVPPQPAGAERPPCGPSQLVGASSTMGADQ
ncbi:MAG: HAMP domain-containing histidine kinase [Actinobacteria bacterium]|nr:HAMP domain-containing histidine kinase [Actinomycetota bacterium]